MLKTTHQLGLKPWQKILLTAICFGIAIIGFIIKLPSAFRGIDRELHAAFYFCAAAFLNILFAKRNLIIHALIFGGLYLFGMAIEHAQVYSKQAWKIPHGRYDPEDVQGNLNGLIVFSAIWLVYIAVYYLMKPNKYRTSQTLNNHSIATEKLVYEDPNGQYYLQSYSPRHSELVLSSSNSEKAAIDLVFKEVQNIQLPTTIHGIKIYVIEQKDETHYKIVDNSGNVSFVKSATMDIYNHHESH